MDFKSLGMLMAISSPLSCDNTVFYMQKESTNEVGAGMMTNSIWVLKIIDSCKNSFQLEASRNAVELFKKKYKDEEECDMVYKTLLRSYYTKESMITVT